MEKCCKNCELCNKSELKGKLHCSYDQWDFPEEFAEGYTCEHFNPKKEAQ